MPLDVKTFFPAPVRPRGRSPQKSQHQPGDPYRPQDRDNNTASEQAVHQGEPHACQGRRRQHAAVVLSDGTAVAAPGLQGVALVRVTAGGQVFTQRVILK